MSLRNVPLAALILNWILASACTADGSREVWVTPNVLMPGGEATVHYKGRFADKPNLTLRYGFNGWNRIDGVNNLETEDDKGNTNFFKEALMTKLPDSGFRVTISVPQDARALHYVFYHNDNGAKRWDNNQRRDYRTAITYPYIGPYLTWNHNTGPEDGVVVNYRTGTPAQTRVEYGKTPSLGNEFTGTASRESHHVELTGLDPDTLYYYRVYGANGVSSPVYSFKTSAPNTTTFSFAVTADMQDNGDDRRWNDVAAELMTNHADVDFVLIAGDMPWNNQPGHWWTFFDNGRQLLASKVIMPAVGNHDTPRKGSHSNTSEFEELFDLPRGSGSETYYSFRFGNAQFLSLNSEIPDQFTKDSGAQYQWVRDQLDSDNADRAWLFAYWHIPPYDAARRHYREQGLFRDMTALFDGKVDWVFNGHEHLYQRFKPLRYNAKLAAAGTYGNGDSDGVGYLIVPPAGNYPARKVIRFDSPVSRYRNRLAFPSLQENQNKVDSQIGFVKVFVAANAINIQTFGMGTLSNPRDSQVVDSVSYTK